MLCLLIHNNEDNSLENDDDDDGDDSISIARSTGGPWQIWESLDTKENRAVMQKLQKGQEYQFRVSNTHMAPSKLKLVFFLPS